MDAGVTPQDRQLSRYDLLGSVEGIRRNIPNLNCSISGPTSKPLIIWLDRQCSYPPKMTRDHAHQLPWRMPIRLCLLGNLVSLSYHLEWFGTAACRVSLPRPSLFAPAAYLSRQPSVSCLGLRFELFVCVGWTSRPTPSPNNIRVFWALSKRSERN